MSDPNARIVYVVRLCYGRTGAPVWLAHLDMMRTMERSLQRAQIDLAYSMGFNPRPEMVFALPAGVGIECDHDYVDVYLNAPMDACDLLERLKTSVPPGVEPLAAVSLPEKPKSIMGMVREAEYEIIFPGAASYGEAVEKAETLMVRKLSKKKYRDVDIRPLVLRAGGPEVVGAEGEKRDGVDDGDRLCIRVLAGSSQNLRPDLLCEALKEHLGAPADLVDDARIIRRELYITTADGQGIAPPLSDTCIHR